ncbi:MAG: hypothetical protein FJ213_07115 [Ignavibacteria bacterium]|nr:hypothetical protein [Ignavibacteria bacterium]
MDKELTKCNECGSILDRINFTTLMTEQWVWNGDNWECCAHNSLSNDPNQLVRCPECDAVVGTGKDFGF